MRAGIDHRQVLVGMRRELVGMGDGGGAQHKDSMRCLIRRLGKLPVAETVQEASIDSSTIQVAAPNGSCAAPSTRLS